MENEVNIQKAKDRLDMNQRFLGIVFTVFVFILALKAELLKKSIFIPIELACAIPLFLSATFANSKLIYAKKKKMWENYSLITFILGYSFLINVVGILMSLYISVEIGMLFFIIVIISPIIYSILAVVENPTKLKIRIIEDSFFISVVLLGGVLPALLIY